MPGMVDTHIHAPQYVFAGSNMDLQLRLWLSTYTLPTEAKMKDLDFANDVCDKVVVRLMIPRSNMRVGSRVALSSMKAFMGAGLLLNLKLKL